MGERKALVLGVEHYEGPRPSTGRSPRPTLWDLPAAATDVARMEEALVACGFEVEVVDDDGQLGTAAALSRRIDGFVQRAAKDDVLVIYFSGHGINADGDDCILPAGVTVDEARQGAHRVSTDLSHAVARSQAGLVLFIIDACREASGEEWGKSRRSTDEGRFIRLFASSTASPTAYTLDEYPPVSLFTKALAAQLSTPSVVCVAQLLEETGRALAGLAQAPRVDEGERSSMSDYLERRIFTKRGAGGAPVQSTWPFGDAGFDPSRLHCLVVSSEHEAAGAPIRPLAELVDEALSTSIGRPVWDAFRALWSTRTPLTRNPRPIGDFEPAAVRLCEQRAGEIFASAHNFHAVVKACVEADLVVFDVTGWEPAVMLLIGIRSAARRGVTVCSFGGDWLAGEPIEGLPFGLKDLSLHALGRYQSVDDRNAERFAERAAEGFRQLARQPHYLDLPAHDALRQLGSDYEASGTIGIGERFLVFCPYDEGAIDRRPSGGSPDTRASGASDGYERSWRRVKAALRKALTQRGLNDDVQRLIDVGTPQMISRSLFEYLRRAEACLFDWTEFNGSVFLELGVRLAVSPSGAMQIIEGRWLPGGDRSPRVGSDAADLPLAQITGMVKILEPIPYHSDDVGAVERAMAEVVEQSIIRSRVVGAEQAYNHVHRIVRSALSNVATGVTPVHVALANEADSLHHPMQGTRGAPQVLFYGNQHVKADAELAALERRVASWLYLEHRLGAGRAEQGDPTRDMHRRIGTVAATELYRQGDLELAALIQRSVEAYPLDDGDEADDIVARLLAATAMQRSRGDALRSRKLDGVDAAYAAALHLLERAEGYLTDPDRNDLDRLGDDEPVPPEQSAIAASLAEALAQQGGLLRRLGRTDESLDAYRRAAAIEARFCRDKTYARVNYVKEALGRGETTLAAETDQLTRLVEDLRTQLEQNQAVRDSGWSWADLGDCCALLGWGAAARDAYEHAIERTQTDALGRTLDVLVELQTRMAANGDPGSVTVAAMVAELQRALPSGATPTI